MQLCCKDMDYHLNRVCRDHPDTWECSDTMIISFPTQDIGVPMAYGLPIHDAGNAYINIAYCPWCGTKLNRVD